MDWNKIDLKSPYETSRELLDGYTTDDLLLEIGCNLKEINEQTVRAQFEQSLNVAVNSAREIFEANIDRIVRHAQKERAKP